MELAQTESFKTTKNEPAEKIRTPCEALPTGWSKEIVTRRSGLSAGKSDVYYYRYHAMAVLCNLSNLVNPLLSIVV